MDAPDAAPPRFQCSPDSRFRPDIPALVCLIAEVPEQNWEDQLRASNVLALCISSVDAQEHLCRTLSWPQRLRARPQGACLAAYLRLLISDVLLQALNARAHVLHELRHPNTHFGSVAVHVEASVVRVYEHEQEQLLKLQVTLTSPKGQRVVPFMLLF